MKEKITPELLARYARGLCSEEEKKVVLAWLADDNATIPSNAEAENMPAIEEELWQALSRKQETAVTGSKQIRNWIFQAAAACVATLLVFGGLHYLNKQQQLQLSQTSTPSEEVVFTAPDGKSSKIELPDHSTVTLAPGSVVRYPARYTQPLRTFALESGEGFFEITHNPSMPFVVSTSATKIEVLGTKFNIRNKKGASKLQVTLTEGSIRFAGAKTGPVILRPGQQLEYNKKKAVTESLTAVDIRYVTAWANDLLWFKETPFGEVIDRIAAHYNVEFKIQGNLDMHFPLNGKFENKSLSYTLRLLENSTGYRFSQQGQIITINN